MKLNCDLGESYGAWSMGQDQQLMPYIDLANIACGFHAGDPLTIQRTITLAKQHHVTLGAHPSYPDLNGFGRRSMQLSHDEIITTLHYQIAALQGMALSQGVTISYVKPHGALYNDMMRQSDVFTAVIEAMASFHTKLPLVIQATPGITSHKAEADTLGVTLWTEAFADRAYTDEGLLLPRSMPDAILSEAAMLAQVSQLVQHGTVRSHTGKLLTLNPDTLCVHGDNPHAITHIKKIRALIPANHEN